MGAAIPAQTAVLAVWRTLYVERDSMKAPDFTGAGELAAGLAVAPSWLAPEKTPASMAADGVTITLTDLVIKPGAENQFHSGRVTLLDEDENVIDTVGVESNTTGPMSTITVRAVFDDPERVKFIKDLKDDDLLHAAGNITAADMEITAFDKLRAELEKANIVLNTTKNDLGSRAGNVNEKGLDFKTNLTATDLANYAKDASAGGNRQSIKSDEFWVVHLLGAFQYALNLDGDPNSEDAVMGVREAFLAGGNLFNPVEIAGIMREVIRDVAEQGTYLPSEAELVDLTVAHEVGHMFGLAHEESHGSLMVISSFETMTYTDLIFSGLGLRMIANCKRPGIPNL